MSSIFVYEVREVTFRSPVLLSGRLFQIRRGALCAKLRCAKNISHSRNVE